MNGTLKEQDLQKHPSTRSLPVLDATDQRAMRCLSEEGTYEFAEAADTIRLYELLHRGEYQPVAVVRDRSEHIDSFRVLFRQLHTTDYSSSEYGQSGQTDRSRRQIPR